MAERLQGKIAVVTGAGSGMGRAIAEAFAAEGAKVICADITGRQEDVARAIGDAALPVRADVSLADDVRGMIAAAEARFGRLDILVNNAGISGAYGPFHEQDEETFDRVIAVNLRGVFLGMKYGVAAMLRSGGGAIVNTASAAGLIGTPGFPGYSASKGGVVLLTKSVALEYADRNIRANAICPGMIWTAMNPASDGSRIPPKDQPPPRLTPMGRWGLDTEIAATAVFLASDEAAFMTGVALPIDGALTAG